MLPRATALLLVLLVLTGCGQERTHPKARAKACHAVEFAGGRAQECALVVGGDRRRYFLRTPPEGTDEPGGPAVIVLHGVGGPLATPEATAEASQFDRLGNRRGVTVAYADGQGDAYFAALLDAVVERHGVDPRRRYVAGWSGGGYAVHRIACRLADRVAAIGVLQAPLRGDCHPARPVAVLQMTGHEDPFIPVGPATARAMRRWARLDRCRGGRSPRWPVCARGTAVTWIDLPGAGHDWYPGATRTLLRFFADHPQR